MKTRTLVSTVCLVLVLILCVGALGYFTSGFKNWNAQEWFTKPETTDRQLMSVNSSAHLAQDGSYYIARLELSNYNGGLLLEAEVDQAGGTEVNSWFTFYISGQYKLNGVTQSGGFEVDATANFKYGFTNGVFSRVIPKTFVNSAGKTIELIAGVTYKARLTYNSVNIESALESYSANCVYEDNAVSLPENPTQEHYSFAGWYLDAALTQAYDGRAIYEDTVLYAKFTPVTYYVTFNTGYTDITVAQKGVTALTAVGTLSTPSAPVGYKFVGWYTDASRTAAYTAVSSMTGNFTLYAKYEAVNVKVTFMVGGTVYKTLDVPYGSTLKSVQAQVAALSIVEVVLDSGEEVADMTELVFLSDATVYAVEDDSFGGQLIDGLSKYWYAPVLGILLLVVIAALIPKNKSKKY